MATPKVKPAYSPRLKQEYGERLIEQLKKDLGLGNAHQVPKLEKIVLNVGLGRAKDEKRLLEAAINTLSKITGQQPVSTTAKKSIASFKLREGNKIGVMVTLRGQRMYEFADRFINVVLPRLRDFHGTSRRSFDKQGNYSIGLNDQSVFPELTYEDTSTPHGVQIIFVIRSQSASHSLALMEALGLPYEKEEV